MQKVILFVVIAIVVVMVIINGGGNTSSQELMLDAAQVSNKISEINSAISTAGDLAYSSVWIEQASFKGSIEQPASSAIDAIDSYIVKGDAATPLLSLNYGTTSVTATGAAPYDTGLQIADGNIPKASRTLVAAATGLVGTASTPVHPLDGIDAGVQPVLKGAATDRASMMELLIFSEQGLALDRLTQHSTEIAALKGDPTKQQAFLAWVFGNVSDGKPIWNEYKIDRILALKQVNTKSLTGLDMSNETVAGLTDFNRVGLYEVAYVNMTNFTKLKAGLATAGVTVDAAKQDKFISDLANHLNQMVGGKTLLIPNNDTFIVYDSDGNPTFKLN